MLEWYRAVVKCYDEAHVSIHFSIKSCLKKYPMDSYTFSSIMKNENSCIMIYLRNSVSHTYVCQKVYKKIHQPKMVLKIRIGYYCTPNCTFQWIRTK